MNVPFYVHDASGRVLRGGVCSAYTVPMQARGAHEFARLGEARPDLERVVGEDVVPLPERPSPHHAFDYALGAWIDPRTLDSLQLDVHAAIARWRDTQESAGMFFEHAGRRWDGGLIVRQRLQPVLGLPALPKGFFWTDASNEDVPMDMPTLQALAVAHEQALVLRGFEIHARQRAMKAEISAMARDELLGFVPGWPTET